MGIKNLNSFLEKHAKLAINEQNLSRYKNKKIAIDTSIFLYKFMYSGKFESFINQVYHFRRFDIIPMFLMVLLQKRSKKYWIIERNINLKFNRE